MAKNPFGGGSKAPKADPNIGRLAGVAEGLANEAAGIGRDQLAWSKVMEQARLGVVRPEIERQFQAASDAYDRGNAQFANYRGVYQPNEGIQALDAMGAGWLSAEEQNRLLGSQADQRLRSIADAYDAEMAQIEQARARDATSPIPADVRAPGATPAAQGRTGAPALMPGSSPGAATPAAPVVTNNPAQSASVYDQASQEATRRYEAEKLALQNQLGYQRELVNASKAAEDAAAGRATADATQAEGRFIEGLDSEAARMGVDPSRMLASAGARAPDAAAAAVHGGNTARFAFRDTRTKNLSDTVQSGRQALQLADSEIGLGLDAGNSAIGNTNATLNSNIASRNAGSSWYSAGMQGINSAANLLNTQQQQKMDAFRAKNEQDSGFMDLLGTGVGLWAKSGFAMPSERKKKQRMKPADTEETLEAIKGMDTDSWEYKPGEGDGGAHVGPYADEMAGLGLSDGTTVNPMDTAGLALAGVKQLAKKLDRIEAGLESARRPRRVA